MFHATYVFKTSASIFISTSMAEVAWAGCDVGARVGAEAMQEWQAPA